MKFAISFGPKIIDEINKRHHFHHIHLVQIFLELIMLLLVEILIVAEKGRRTSVPIRAIVFLLLLSPNEIISYSFKQSSNKYMVVNHI